MQTAEVLELLQDVADRIVRPRFRSLSDGQVMEKNPGDLVTVADREAEVAITDVLRSAYPDALIVGEEAVAANPAILRRAGDAGHWFTVDPIDGTKNFVHGSPDHAVMVAELQGPTVTRSWIWQPEHQLAYVAELGSGAWCGDRRLTIDPSRRQPDGRTSWRREVGQSLGGDLPPMTLTWASCGVDYPKLVEGETDYIVYGGTMPWDHAPGSLLLTEAGGVVGYPDLAPYDPTTLRKPLIAAGSRTIFEQVAPKV